MAEEEMNAAELAQLRKLVMQLTQPIQHLVCLHQ